ncbi:MAG: N-acetylmuramoyl-L-alanine amidase [Clostridia bacterium]|nr:N-acetylmuramoyl-L-alanine amidase [Clostridia bacterium]
MTTENKTKKDLLSKLPVPLLIAVIAVSASVIVAVLLMVFLSPSDTPVSADIRTEQETAETDTETQTETEEETIEVKEEMLLQADKFPKNESKDFYKSDEKLFNRAVMYSANELKGKFDNVIFKYDGLTLQDVTKDGVFISNDIKPGGEFRKLIMSWNADTSGGTVEVEVMAKLSDGTYTEPYSWGVWSAIPGVSASRSRKDEHGELDIDTLNLKEKCSAVKLKITLKKTAEKAPVLYNVTVATDRAKQEISKNTVTKKIKLSVKKRYQLDVPEIGGVICSPTSLSMVRDYYKEKGFETVDTAKGVYDNGEGIYGNWSYNVAYAGELGYNAYVDIYDMKALKWALSKNVPVICSVKIKKGQLKDSGYPDYSTNGHLLCVIGYETVDGVEWLIVNDPAKKQVEVKYLASEFETIWPGTVYIVQEKPERYTWRIGEGTEQDILVVADCIPEGRYNRPGGNYKVKYIVIHNTGNFSTGADANSHRSYVKEDGCKVSWHYTVDDKRIYKHLPEEERAWHAGDGREGKGNTYGIGIEMCVNHETLGTKNPTEYFYKTMDNTAQLVAELLYKYDLSIKAVKQHWHFSGKNCPQVIRENDLWEPFLENIQQRYDKIKAERG